MTPERFRECLALPGWSYRKLAQRLGIDDAAARKMASGKKTIPDNLDRWLEDLAGVWTPLSADARELARAIGCDQGKFVERPRGMPPLPAELVTTLRALAEWHESRPLPEGWRQGPAAGAQ